MKLLRITLIPICSILISTLVYSEVNICLFGKVNFYNSAGNESDYGEGNDFPIVSSHQNFGFGVGFTYRIAKAFIGFEGHYNSSGKCRLEDPSDGDSVEINSFQNFSGFLTIGYTIIRSQSVRLFITGGGGVGYTLGAENRTYVSQFGYDTIIAPPERKYPLTGFGGASLEWDFTPSTSFLFGVRYLYIDFERPQTGFFTLAGIVFKL